MKIRLRTRLALFNLLSKIVFSVLFIALLPFIVNRISLIQADNELVDKREQVIDIIGRVGIEPFIDDSLATFGSYNILKEEFPQVYKQVKRIGEIDIPKVEREMEKLGAPVTPGRLPEWLRMKNIVPRAWFIWSKIIWWKKH